ncbi:MAG: DUF4395 domain-containing protein [Fibrobacterota bacterium]
MVCPIAGYKIDEKVARVVAGFVVLATVFGVLAAPGVARGIFLFLAYDFGVRAISRPRWSLLGRLSAQILKALRASPRGVDAGPKRFAARIGLLFSVALVVLTHFDLRVATQVVAAILVVCAALEAFLGFCLGCQMWTLWYSLRDRVVGQRARGFGL